MGIGPSEPKRTTFYARQFCERLRIACTQTFTVELMDISGLWDLSEKEVEELFYLLVFGVLEMKDDVGRKGRKNRKIQQKNCMHWNMAPDTLLGSATFVRVLDCWLNDYFYKECA